MNKHTRSVSLINGHIEGITDKLVEEQKAEIERLNIRNEALTDITKNYDWKFAKAKSEAIKEFAERLKRYKAYVSGWDIYVVREHHIDNLVKEMAGE